MFFFLALRNISKNKKNSAIIALLIGVITFLFFIGNSVTGRADRSIRSAYIESLTGDVVVEKTSDVTMNLFGANTPVIDNYFTIPVLPAYDAVMEIIAAEPGIAGITSQVSGRAYLDLDMPGVRWEGVLLAGIDAGSYFPLFSGIDLEEGRFLQANESGAMITAERARRIEKLSGQYPVIGMPLILLSGGSIGCKIREVPLVGIFSYLNPGQFMNEIILTDPQTVRVLNSIQVAGGAAAGEEAMSLLAFDPDDLFGEAIGSGNGTEEDGFSADMLHAFLSDTANENLEETGGDWHFILLRLEKGSSASAIISSLNKKLNSYGLTAVNWRIAAGTSAIMMLMVQALYNAGVFLVSIAGIITVINILLIAVFRRTREIGTLRAIGASDTYIRSLVLSENLVIALFSGILGVLGGFFFLRWVNNLGFVIPNDLIASLLGGPILRIDFMTGIAVLSFLLAVALGLTASVYPVEAAVRIEPMAAVRRG